ncbi:MAG: aminopeptidase P N-terminal domain-containing protein [Candidatus Obscuribacterales bacterium]|nr:aminopeptidase P N-terminal domain-containing protein [Candidatus Obscuribacterales bacterium]
MKTSLLTGLPKLPPAPRLSKKTYLARLSRLWERMADNSVCILVSNPERTRSNDTSFPFRQSSDIVYLNGFPEPDSVLVVSKLSGKKKVCMLVRPKNRERETWDGFRHGLEGAKKFCATETCSIEKFDEKIAELIEKAGTVYYGFGVNTHYDKKFRAVFEASQKPLLNPREIIDELRLFKSEDEMKVHRHACLISAEAHKQAMLACRPGVSEYELQAVLEFVFKASGGTGPAYGSIVAAGNNANILHYVENSKKVRIGDLVLIDAGCEFGGVNGGYAGDITRTFPANGKFSQAQKDIYQLVLDAQLAAIKLSKPGVRLIELHHAVERVLRRGLRQLGILPADASARVETARAEGDKSLSLGDVYMHGTSHWLGLDVHDVGDYDPEARGRKHRVLAPGMVFTIEPGIYLRKDDKRIPEKYRGIGVRIEDDILITQDGHEVLTAAVPKSVEEIEALMARAA